MNLQDLCERIVRDAIPATDSGATCFVPRYQIDQLRDALSAHPSPADPFAYVVCDGRDVTSCAELQWPRQLRRGPRGAKAAWRDLPPGTHPLYLHPAPAEAQAQGGGEVAA